MKQIKELNIVKESFWNNQSSVLICMYTLCSFYSLFLYKDREIWSRLVYFLLNGLYIRQKVDFHWLVALFQIFLGEKNKTLKVRTFSIGKTRVFGISGRVECSIYTFGRHSSGFIARPYPPCSQYWSNQCRGHQNNTLINEQIITTEQQFKFYSMNDR